MNDRSRRPVLQMRTRNVAEDISLELDNFIVDEMIHRSDFPQYYSEEERTYEAVVAYVRAERKKAAESLERDRERDMGQDE